MYESFDQLSRVTFEMYGTGDYQGALELLEHELENFPGFFYQTYNWRICMNARLDNTSEALRLFTEAIELGLWYSPDMMRNDTDLESLQGNPEFERLLNICVQCQQEAERNTVPERKILQSNSSGTIPLLISLHGNNGNAEQTADFWKPVVSSGWNVLLPQSSQVSGPKRYVWTDQEKSVKEVLNHYEQVSEELSVDKENTVIGGFSMGAGTALWMSLNGMIRTRGFIAIAPYFPNFDELKGLFEKEIPADLHGYFIVGEKDQHAVELAAYVSELMQTKGLDCRVETHSDLGHAYPPTFGDSLTTAIQFITDEE